MSDVRFPRIDEYLARLPEGIDSYPQCLAKASLYRMALEAKPLRDVRGAMPEPLVQLIEQPVPVTAWIPQVHARALYRAILDEHFRDERAYLDWAYQQNRRTFEHRLYEFVMRVISPTMMMRGAEMRWSTFHRGLKLRAEVMDHGASLDLEYPRHLLQEFDTRVHAESFRAALDMSRAHDARVVAAETGPTKATFRATWG